MESISMRLPEQLHARWQRIARERQASLSDVVRDAIEAFLANGSQPTGPTAYDLASDLCGVVDSGLTDLATNKKSMEGNRSRAELLEIKGFRRAKGRFWPSN